MVNLQEQFIEKRISTEENYRQPFIAHTPGQIYSSIPFEGVSDVWHSNSNDRMEGKKAVKRNITMLKEYSKKLPSKYYSQF